VREVQYSTTPSDLSLCPI